LNSKPEHFLAGEGSLGESGLRPLSIALPLSNNLLFGLIKSILSERGTKGVRLIK
jgi:hypothetical protein